MLHQQFATIGTESIVRKKDINAVGSDRSARRGNVVAGLVYVFEQVMPDPFVLAIGLTLVVALLAVAFAPHASLPVILTSGMEARSLFSASRCR